MKKFENHIQYGLCVLAMLLSLVVFILNAWAFLNLLGSVPAPAQLEVFAYGFTALMMTFALVWAWGT